MEDLAEKYPKNKKGATMTSLLGWPSQQASEEIVDAAGDLWCASLRPSGAESGLSPAIFRR